jgi:hypothetical protein
VGLINVLVPHRTDAKENTQAKRLTSLLAPRRERIISNIIVILWLFKGHCSRSPSRATFPRNRNLRERVINGVRGLPWVEQRADEPPNQPYRGEEYQYGEKSGHQLTPEQNQCRVTTKTTNPQNPWDRTAINLQPSHPPQRSARVSPARARSQPQLHPWPCRRAWSARCRLRQPTG